jgi:hypothetical protein
VTLVRVVFGPRKVRVRGNVDKTLEGVVVGFQFLQICAQENFLSVDGGQAEGLMCADPGARTPIGASGNYYISLFLFYHKTLWTSQRFSFLLTKQNKYIQLPTLDKISLFVVIVDKAKSKAHIYELRSQCNLKERHRWIRLIRTGPMKP